MSPNRDGQLLSEGEDCNTKTAAYNPHEYALLPDSVMAGVAFTVWQKTNLYTADGVRILVATAQQNSEIGKFQYKKRQSRKIRTNEQMCDRRTTLAFGAQLPPPLESASLRVFDRILGA